MDDFEEFLNKNRRVSTMKKNPKIITWEKSICVYIDFLGFKTLSAEIITHKNEELIKKIYEAITEFILPMNWHKNKKIKIFSFSDSVIAIFELDNFSPTDKNNSNATMTDFDSAMMIIAVHIPFLILQLMENDIIVRGGVSIGVTKLVEDKDAMGIDELSSYGYNRPDFNFLVSEALVKAHNIEITIKYPFIAVDKETYNYMINLDGLQHYGKDFLNKKDIEKYFVEEIIGNECFYIIDYLFLLYKEDLCFSDVLEKHKELIEKNIKINKNNEEILDKFRRLRKYHNDSIEKISKEFNEDYQNLIISD